MFGNAKFSYCRNQILHPHSRHIIALPILSLAFMITLGQYDLSSSNGIDTSTKEAHAKEQLDDNSVALYLSYYSSIFSNLSRGLPISEGVSISAPVNGQEGTATGIENPNPADQGSQQEQTQESLPSISNNSQ